MKILITGATGMVGTNLCKKLEKNHKISLLAPTRNELNLLDKVSVDNYFKNTSPDLIIHAAARVGGIQANISSPVEFLVENTLINTNVIHCALLNHIPNLLNIGSSCMYPKDRAILREEDLLTGKLEPTNEGYAVAKISATLLCNYINKQYGLSYKTIIPCNLYGPYDNFDPLASHLIPAMIRKLHTAKMNNEKKIIIWGDGKAYREFMYIDDLIDFIELAINQINQLPDLINVGLGYDYTISEYYKISADLMGYRGDFDYDETKPVGMKKKLLDVSKALQLGWKARVSIAEGIQKTYDYFCNYENLSQKHA